MKQKLLRNLEIIGAPLGAVGLPVAQWFLLRLIASRSPTAAYFVSGPFAPSGMPMMFGFGIFILIPFWGALLGGATARAIGAVLRGERGEAAKACLGRASWVVVLQVAIQAFLTYNRVQLMFWAPYSIPAFSLLAVPILTDMALQWSVLLLLAGFTLRRLERGTVQVSENMRW